MPIALSEEIPKRFGAIESEDARQDKMRAKQEPGPAPEFVGLFQGARYSNDYYRPAFECLMKDTSVHRFCRVGTDHVRRRLVE